VDPVPIARVYLTRQIALEMRDIFFQDEPLHKVFSRAIAQSCGGSRANHCRGLIFSSWQL